jgi:hypothetical protein
MNKNILLVAAATLAVGGVGFALGAHALQEPQDAAAPVKPGPEHKIMNQDVGTWAATVKVYMAPESPPMEFTGKETNKWDCNGMWMLSTFDADDGSFSGRSSSGWDAHQKKYVTVWVDSWTPNMMFMSGSHDAASNALNFEGQAPNQMTGKLEKQRSKTEYPGADARRYTSWTTPTGGTETKMVEVSYKRVK